MRHRGRTEASEASGFSSPHSPKQKAEDQIKPGPAVRPTGWDHLYLSNPSPFPPSLTLHWMKVFAVSTSLGLGLRDKEGFLRGVAWLLSNGK